MKQFALSMLIAFCAVLNLSGQTSFGYGSSIKPHVFPESSNLRISNFQIFKSPADTVLPDTVLEKKHSPKKAAWMSAIVPGLGQVYNKKYWKLGIIYPAMGGLVYGFAFNHKNFKVYRDALRIRYDDDPLTIDQFSIYSDDRIVTMKNYYQRYRDLCVIGFAAVYVLQVIDAAVDAHLFYFDVGPDLSMNWGPDFIGDAFGPTTGLRLNITFR